VRGEEGVRGRGSVVSTPLTPIPSPPEAEGEGRGICTPLRFGEGTGEGLASVQGRQYPPHPHPLSPRSGGRGAKDTSR
jgi:hypothetical protein